MSRIDVLRVDARTIRVGDVVPVGGRRRAVVDMAARTRGKLLTLEDGRTFLLAEGRFLKARRTAP
ncbi:hypothetical protein RKE29_18600 [Streptomyces sp. B1866]|uniref:hypothetical protein n=1 Tax=Streptomyces sp. B1866 TaxID=3075431 RepID=UPI00288F2387|nr:hypothetical protein [Streptomyces sp. B1866]MDT3398630.1 hypothetical protein [Streptomyces sp. B1866]